jgi:hypothetical protein
MNSKETDSKRAKFSEDKHKCEDEEGEEDYMSNDFLEQMHVT